MNLQDLLGQVLEQGMAPSAGNRIRNAMNTPEPAGSGFGGLGGILDALTKGAPHGEPQPQSRSQPQMQMPGGDIFGNLAGMAKDIFTQTKDGVQSGSPTAVGGLAALAGAILGGGGGALRGAVGAGALAILAKVAFDAMRQSKAGSTPVMPADLPLGLRDPVNAAERQELDLRAKLMLLAMINAAKADGQIDQKEMGKISGKLQEGGADDATIGFVNKQLQGPLDLNGLISAVPDQEVGLQVYAASLLAIEADTAAEKQYLQRLASGLGLDSAAVSRVHAILGVPA